MRKLVGVAGLALLLIVIAPRVLSTSATTSDWLKDRYDAGNSSYNPYEGIISPANVNTLAEAWSLNVHFAGSPVVSNGMVYDSCLYQVQPNPIDPQLCAVDTVKGTLTWHSQQLGSIAAVSTPAVDNGLVFVGDQEPAGMVALDANTGRVVWGHGVPNGYQVNDGPTVVNGTVFFTPDDGNLWALDESTGATKWTTLTGNFGGVPAYTNGVVYVDGFQRTSNGSPNEFVDAINATTGAQVWHATPQLGYQGATLVIDNGLVLHYGQAYFTSGCAPSNTCDPIWTYGPGTSGTNVTTPFAVSKGVGYIGMGDDSVHAVDLSNGTLLWRGVTNGADYHGIPVGGPSVANGLVFAGAQDGRLYAWNASGCGQSTCQPLWSIALAPSGSEIYVKSVPAVANGAVYVNTSDGVLHALTLGGTTPLPATSATPPPSPGGPPPPSGSATFIDMFATPSTVSEPSGITTGPDGALWFAEYYIDKIGRAAPDGKTMSEYGGLKLGSLPEGITVGPDKQMWFTESGQYDSSARSVGPGQKIGRMSLYGGLTAEYTTPTTPSGPEGITVGPDNNIWFTENYASKVARLDVSTGVITEFPLSHPDYKCAPRGITAGPDGAIWFTEFACNKIGRMDMNGNLTEFGLSSATTQPLGIAVGRDGALWFTEWGNDRIGRLTMSGDLSEWSLPSGHHNPQYIAAGPDGAMWFTERVDPRIGRISMEGVISEHLLPGGTGSYSQPWGITKGPDGNMWFTDFYQQIGRVNVAVWDQALWMQPRPMPTRQGPTNNGVTGSSPSRRGAPPPSK